MDFPRTFKVLLAYRGTLFSGWQRQVELRTVQEVVENCVEKLVGTHVPVRAAGRTDAGVHARAQPISFTATTRIPVSKLCIAMNSLLPDDVAAVHAERVGLNFCAKRFSVGKLYRYHVLRRRLRDPFRAPTHMHVKGMLDVNAMREAAAHFVGTHDFESFRALSCVAQHARRYLWAVDVAHDDDDNITIDVRGSAFCQHMVRIIAGTLIDVGYGRLAANAIPEIIAARRRDAAGITAPAHGLTLLTVYYPNDLSRAQIPPDAVFPRHPPSPSDIECTTAIDDEEAFAQTEPE